MTRRPPGSSDRVGLAEGRVLLENLYRQGWSRASIAACSGIPPGVLAGIVSGTQRRIRDIHVARLRKVHAVLDGWRPHGLPARTVTRRPAAVGPGVAARVRVAGRWGADPAVIAAEHGVPVATVRQLLAGAA